MILDLFRGFVHALVYGALTAIGLAASVIGALWLFAPEELLA